MDIEKLGPSGRARPDEKAGAGNGALDLWWEAPGSEGSGLPLSPMDAYLFARRNFRRILLGSLVAGGAFFGGSVLLFNKYTATATIMVDPRTANITQGAGVLPNIGADAIAIESLVQVCKSDSFLGGLVDRLDLVHDADYGERYAAIDKLGAQLNVSRRGTTYVIDATATNRSAEKSARIANAAAQAMIDGQRELRAGADDKAASDIEARLAAVSARVDRAERAAAELKASLKVTDVGQGQTLLERRVYELNQQLVLATAKAGNARARFDQLRRAGSNAAADLAPEIQSNLLNNLRSEYARLTRQSADQATVLGARHPAVAALNAQLADTRQQIRAELSRLLAKARADVLEADQDESSLGDQLKQAQQESGELGPQMVKLDELEREAKAERSIYEQLLGRRKELAGTKDLAPSDFHFVSPATPPARIKPTLPIRAAVSAALGLLCALAYALLREAITAALTTPRQAERLLGVKVGGLAPLLTGEKSAKSGKSRGADRGPDLAPWVGELCAELTGDSNRKKSRVMLVSSAFQGAGRSTVAAGCASHFANGGARVLLVEADRPASTSAQPGFGLIDVLESGEDLPLALVRKPGSGYTVLPFGGVAADGNASVGALMSGVTLRALMKLCRDWFDIVIIDGPPALEAGHARLLARESDLAVLVVEWNKTSPSDVNEAIESLDTEETLLFFNGVDVARLRLLDPAEARRMEAQSVEFERAA